jgi:DNA modification methylase
VSVTILKGDCREVLRTLPSESVHCVVTSPPYWGLRDYGTAKWEGGDPGCKHIAFQKLPTVGSSSTLGFPADGGPRRITEGNNYHEAYTTQFKDNCGKCGARRIDSQLGLEPTYQEYVASMVEVFREVRRVLRRDGTLWLVLGDSYYNGDKGGYAKDRVKATDSLQKSNLANNFIGAANRQPQDGFKPKDLCGIPWRLAFALQADGWWLRQDIIWSKPNPMPESVTDRCTKAHEYLFLLSKSERYYYDAEAIKEDAGDDVGPGVVGWAVGKDHTAVGHNIGSRADSHGARNPRKRDSTNSSHVPGAAEHTGLHRIGSDREPPKRNKRSVWEIATQPFPEAHFATFPPALIEPCIKAGTSEKGCCAKCGAAWVREVGKNEIDRDRPLARQNIIEPQVTKAGQGTNVRGSSTYGHYLKGKPTLGWSSCCSCNAATIPCAVLDPFGGAGTTGLVADRLGRNAILIELNPEYAAMAERRLLDDAGMFAQVAAE